MLDKAARSFSCFWKPDEEKTIIIPLLQKKNFTVTRNILFELLKLIYCNVNIFDFKFFSPLTADACFVTIKHNESLIKERNEGCVCCSYAAWTSLQTWLISCESGPELNICLDLSFLAEITFYPSTGLSAYAAIQVRWILILNRNRAELWEAPVINHIYVSEKKNPSHTTNWSFLSSYSICSALPAYRLDAEGKHWLVLAELLAQTLHESSSKPCKSVCYHQLQG